MSSRFYRQFEKSGAIKSVSFLGDRSGGPKNVGTLRLKFRSGATYQYDHAHAQTVARFLLDAVALDSVGRSYHRHIHGHLTGQRLAPRIWNR